MPDFTVDIDYKIYLRDNIGRNVSDLQYNMKRKGIICVFCRNAIPRLPLTCAKMIEAIRNMNNETL